MTSYFGAENNGENEAAKSLRTLLTRSEATPKNLLDAGNIMLSLKEEFRIGSGVFFYKTGTHLDAKQSDVVAAIVGLLNFEGAYIIKLCDLCINHKDTPLEKKAEYVALKTRLSAAVR